MTMDPPLPPLLPPSGLFSRPFAIFPLLYKAIGFGMVQSFLSFAYAIFTAHFTITGFSF